MTYVEVNIESKLQFMTDVNLKHDFKLKKSK